jgi:hypothetical protein
MARNARKALPTLEGLEDRMLLDGKTIDKTGQPINDKDLRRAQVQLVNIRNGSKLADRRLTFRTPQGNLVLVTLYGQGTLRGSSQDPDGALNIVYDDTNASSQITARVSHRGRAQLRSLRDIDVDFGSISGVGSNQLAAVRMDQLDLVDGGRVNLAGGVDFLRLRSIGADTVIDARSLPLSADEVNPSPTSPQPVLQFVDTANGTELAGVGGLTTPGSGATTTTGAAPAGFTTRINPDGTVDLIPTSAATTDEEAGFTGGLSIVVDRINGLPRTAPLNNSQIYGYDPGAQQLIRFDARTGGVLASASVPNNGATETGVGLGRVAGRQVVLVGTANVVQVFDATTMAPVGSFTTGSLAGFTQVTGIGQTDANVELSDSTANLVVPISVEQSLAARVAVAVGDPFAPTREFTLSGGATGVAGQSNAYLTGAAHFDTFQPDATQFGVLTVATANDDLSESARTAVTSPSSIITNVPPGNTPIALGSVDQSLALVTAVDPSAGTNTVTLYDPRTLTTQATVAFRWPNRLTGLSESFHPELAGAAVMNVGGILRRFQVIEQATGLVLNTVGFLNQITAPRVVDSAFVGQPVGHVNIGVRENVTITSSSDRGSTQGGVFIVPGLRVVGPLALPG